MREENMIPYYFLSIRSMGIGVVAGINGADIIVEPLGTGIGTLVPVNAWLMPSGNHFQVTFTQKVAQVPAPDQKPGPEPSVAIAVFEADPDSDEPKPGNLIFEYQWPDPANSEKYPYTHRVPLEISKPPITNVWTEAAILDGLNSTDESGIFAEISKLERALSTARTQDAFDLVTYRYEEEALAEGKPKGTFHPVVLEQYEWMCKQEGFHALPMKREDANFKLLDSKQIVQLNRGAYGRALSFRADGGLQFEIPLFAAKIQNHWRIVR